MGVETDSRCSKDELNRPFVDDDNSGDDADKSGLSVFLITIYHNFYVSN